jgi:hypothetical protein
MCTKSIVEKLQVQQTHTKMQTSAISQTTYLFQLQCILQFP